jgi:hypothetical protein
LGPQNPGRQRQRYNPAMDARRLIPLALVPFLLASKPDTFARVAPADLSQFKSGLARYVHDQETRNWADLYEIAVPGYAVRGDFDDPAGKNEPFLKKPDFVSTMESNLEGGVLPVLQSFELRSINPTQNGYEIRACSKSQRENFHFKGIVTFNAYRIDGQVRFGAWRYVYAMPHSCDQTSDSQ